VTALRENLGGTGSMGEPILGAQNTSDLNENVFKLVKKEVAVKD
jgi:hypothetical protein